MTIMRKVSNEDGPRGGAHDNHTTANEIMTQILDFTEIMTQTRKFMMMTLGQTMLMRERTP